MTDSIARQQYKRLVAGGVDSRLRVAHIHEGLQQAAHDPTYPYDYLAQIARELADELAYMVELQCLLDGQTPTPTAPTHPPERVIFGTEGIDLRHVMRVRYTPPQPMSEGKTAPAALEATFVTGTPETWRGQAAQGLWAAYRCVIPRLRF